MDRTTPLYEWHRAHGGKIVPFAGYLLPVQYGAGVIAEHLAVRNAAGLFDVSHMGEILVSGDGAREAVERLVTADCRDMDVGRVRYALLCDESGGIVDDLVVCKLDDGRYLLVVNAANREKDFAWISANAAGVARVEDASDSYAQIALQGPASPAILSRLADASSIPEKYYTFVERGTVAGIRCIVSKTGYTGETGYELYCAPADATRLWEALMDAGSLDGLIPCGLGCRDTLRLEAAMPLYGHEMTDAVTPFEAALARAVSLGKGPFIGREALAAKANPPRIRVGLAVTGHGIARGGESVLRGGVGTGTVTSGSWLPSLGGAYALAMVRPEDSVPGTRIEIEIRGKPVEALVTALPFYRRKKQGE
jgi:aminomethyltransferase